MNPRCATPRTLLLATLICSSPTTAATNLHDQLTQMGWQIVAQRPTPSSENGPYDQPDFQYRVETDNGIISIVQEPTYREPTELPPCGLRAETLEYTTSEYSFYAWDCGEWGAGLIARSARGEYRFENPEPIRQFIPFRGELYLLAGGILLFPTGSLYRLDTQAYPPRLERVATLADAPIQATPFRDDILLILTRRDLLALDFQAKGFPMLYTWINQGPWSELGATSITVLHNYAAGQKFVIGTQHGIVAIGGRLTSRRVEPGLEWKEYRPTP